MFSEENQATLEGLEGLFSGARETVEKVKQLEAQYQESDRAQRALIAAVDQKTDSAVAVLEECREKAVPVKESLGELSAELMALVDRFEGVAQMAIRDHRRVQQLEGFSREIAQRLQLPMPSPHKSLQ